jgi:3-isopropylmalate/(R)-2-methylmalate dehydratase small subunit
MQANRPEFAREVGKGDVIVAGKNFGCGSTRPASGNLVQLGIGGVIAESFGRIFIRNSINYGLPVLYCKGVYESFNEGDILQADFSTGEVKNLTTGKVLKSEPLPEVAMKILKAGGIVAMLEKEYGGSNNP